MGGGRVSVGTDYESDRAEKADAFTTSSDFSTTDEDLAGKHASKRDNIYGPVQKRSVRDIPFLILFILFVLAWIALGAFSFFAGDLDRLRYGADSEGNICGVKGAVDLTGRPFLFLYPYYDVAPQSGIPTPFQAVCVAQCPTGQPVDFTSVLFSPDSSGLNLMSQYCVYNTTLTNANYMGKIVSGDCPAVLWPSISLMNRCLPNLLNDVNSTANAEARNLTVAELDAQSYAMRFYQSLSSSWQVIIICVGIAFAASLIWLLLLQFLGGCIVWTSIVLVLVSLMLLTAYLWYNWYMLHTGQPTFLTIQFDNPDVMNTLYNENVFLAFAIVASIATAILLLLLCIFGRRINLALKIISEASKAIQRLPLLLALPLLKFIYLAALVLWFIVVLSLLSSMSNLTTTSTAFTTQQLKSFVPYLIVFHVFGLFWTWNFGIAVGECTIAGAVATWYWSWDKQSMPHFTVLRSLTRAIIYHSGSLAFGSLIIAILQLIRFLLYQLARAVNKSKNRVVKWICCCLQCCFACLERIFKLISRNAYIEVAMYGHSFCEGAKRAVELLTRNAFRFAALEFVSEFLIILVKLTITVGCAVIAFFLLKRDQADFFYYAVPMVMVILLSYGISTCFMIVFDMAIDTIFLCFCEDSERNDGSQERPYYAPRSLKKFMDHSAEEPEESESEDK